MGFSASGLAIFPMGAVLVDMNFGGSSAGGPAGFRILRTMDGGATGRVSVPTGPSEEALAEVAEGIRGFSLIVFLAADEAEAEFGEAGIRFRAAVSVLRIFSGSLTPPGALLSDSAILKSFRIKNYFPIIIHREYSI